LAEDIAPTRTLLRPPAGTRRLSLTPGRVLVLLAVLAIAAIVAYMTIGAKGSWSFVLPFRGTKVWAMTVVGCAIAISTVLFQTISANRILTPSIMGFDALYALIQTALVFLLGGLAYATIDPQLRFVVEVAAMVLFSGLLFRSLFSGAARSLYLLVLVGIVFGVFFRSLSGLMQRLINPNDFAILQDALFARFSAIDPTLLTVSTAAVALVCLWIFRMLPVLDVLSLGHEHAVNLGVDHKRAVSAILVMVAILVSVSTALVGPVTFFGLLVSNLAYLLIRSHRHALILPATALLAVICLVGGQVVLERVFGFDTALSIIIEFVGGLVFIAILLKGKGR
jgi:ABC-type enterochelin transport system, permease component